MEHAARLRGYNLLLATTDYSSERESAVVEELLRQRVDGLVLTVTDAESNRVLQSLDSEDTPFVLAYHQPGNPDYPAGDKPAQKRSEKHTYELQSLMRSSYAVFFLKKKKEQ